MSPNNEFDYEDWNRRFDAGERSDALLELAARLQQLSPMPDAPSPIFEAGLRANLLEQYGRRVPVSRFAGRRPIAWGLALMVVAVLAFVGMRFLSGNVPTVSAAEVLGKASDRLSARLAAGHVVYDRLLLDWDQGGDWKRKGVVAELWRSADGASLRYQLFDDGDLLFFEQHDGEQLWRSSQVRPVEGVKVTFVYQAPYDPGPNEPDDLADKQLIAQLLFRDLSTFWLNIDQITGAENSACADLFCSLSALGEGWECAESDCTLNLGPILGDKELIITAAVTRHTRLSNGKEVYEVRLSGSEFEDQFHTLLKFDTTTFDLLELEDYWQGQFHYRISLVERKTLARRDLPAGFFQTVPQGIEVRPWHGSVPLGHKEDDRVWIISAEPPSGASLTGEIAAQLEIGYQLTSVQEADIEVGMSWVGHDSPYAVPDARATVTGGEGTVQVSFIVNTDRLGEGNWAVGAAFMDRLGVSPGSGWNGGGAPIGVYLEWCVRCPTEAATP